MTTDPKYDKAIIEAAERLEGAWNKLGLKHEHFTMHPEAIALKAALTTKREAARPRLLTAQEAGVVYRQTASVGGNAMRDVLSADRASVLRVLDKELEDAGCLTSLAREGFRALVRRALLPANPLTERD